MTSNTRSFCGCPAGQRSHSTPVGGRKSDALTLRTLAYWLLWRVQQAIPRTAAPARAEFTTLRIWLLKVAALVMESATRIRIEFVSAFPNADLFHAIVFALKPRPT